MARTHFDVDYDLVAAEYDRRYERTRYDDLARSLLTFIDRLGASQVLEVGCGTGHWLSIISPRHARAIGFDPSAEMLAGARSAAPRALLVAARGEALPSRTASFDAVICVNVVHHLADVPLFLREAHRVLRPGGGLFVAALDPGVGRDAWWVYEYFPRALMLDRKRYPSTPQLRELMAGAGFHEVRTFEAQRLTAALRLEEAETQGVLRRESTSQLMLLSEVEYKRGLARLRRDAAAAAAQGREFTLAADLMLFATMGMTPCFR